MRTFSSAAASVLGFGASVVSSPAWACAVCGVSKQENAGAMLQMTMVLSLLPLSFMGGVIGFLIFRAKKAARAAVESPGGVGS